MGVTEWIMALESFVWVMNFAIYIYIALCLHTIANKTDIRHGWFAWIPIANLYLMCRIAEKPSWWLVLFLIPIVNIAFSVIVWMRIAQARDRASWLGILVLVPIANLVLPGFLAFAGGDSRVEESETRANITTPRRSALIGEIRKIGDLKTQTNKETSGFSKAVPTTRSAYNRSLRPIILKLSTYKQLDQFRQYLENDMNLTITMAGGSVAGGSVITISVQKHLDLSRALNEIPMVENANTKGADIEVKLKSHND